MMVKITISMSKIRINAGKGLGHSMAAVIANFIVLLGAKHR